MASLTPGQIKTTRVLLVFLGVLILLGLGLLVWEGYSMTFADDAVITAVVRIAFDKEPGAFMLIYGGVMYLFGHLFWCKCRPCPGDGGK